MAHIQFIHLNNGQTGYGCNTASSDMHGRAILVIHTAASCIYSMSF